MERHHPVTLEQKVSVDIKVARIIAADFNTECVNDFLIVEVLGDITKGGVAKVTFILALSTDIIDVLASSLVWANHGIVAVDASRDARPNALTVIAVLDEALAAGKSVFHSLTLTLGKNSRIPTLPTCHGLVVFILGQPISKTISDKHGLQVNVALLVRKDLGCENRDVVTSV